VTRNNRLTLLDWLQSRIFYGWIIVAAALISIATLIGTRFSFGVFFKSLEAEFGLTRTAISGVFSTYTLLAAAFAIIGGWALDRYGPRLVVIAMGLVTGIGLLITSQTTSIWQVFLSYSVLLAVGTGGALPVIMAVVSRWFYRKRGSALGIATSGTGLGTLVVSPFAAYLILNLGWRMSYVVLGVIVWFIVISMAMLLRADPSKIGALPDGAKSPIGDTSWTNEARSATPVGLTLWQAMRTRSFWLMFSIWLFYASSLNFILTHFIPHATDTGISNITASMVISVTGFFQIISRLLIGRISDSIGRKIPAAISAVGGSIALTWLIWAHNLWMFYLFAVLFGISWGGIGVTTITMVSDIFGELHLGKIMGTIDVGFALGAAVGSALGGLIFDATGSYTAAFSIVAVGMLLIALLVIFTRREVTTELDAKYKLPAERQAQ